MAKDIGFTPGPWGVGLWHGSVKGTASGQTFDGPMAGVFYADGMIAPLGPTNDSESWPNARLIAAAPELYEALEWAMTKIGRPTLVPGQNDEHFRKWEAAHAALAAVRGDQ